MEGLAGTFRIREKIGLEYLSQTSEPRGTTLS
jgi:hypothetical protein